MSFFQQFFSGTGGYIALIAFIIEIYIIIHIIKNYSKALKELIPPETFKLLLEEAINNPTNLLDNNLMVNELLELMGTQRSTETIRAVLKKQLYTFNDTIRSWANLGPAAGLFSTFVGLLFTVYEISKNSFGESIETLNQSFSNLYPVFIGGAFGIFVFGLGIFLLNRLQISQMKLEDELLRIFLIFESTHEPPKPKTIEDAYKKLLRPLTNLVIRFESLQKGFDNLSNKTESLVDVFSKKTNEFIEKVDEKANDIFRHFNDEFHKLSNITETSLNGFLLQANKIIEGFDEKANDTFRHFDDEFQKLSNSTEILLKGFLLQTNKFIEGFDEKTNDFIEKLQSNINVLENSADKITELNGVIKESSNYWRSSASSLSNFSQSIQQVENRLQILASFSEQVSELIGDLKKNTNNIDKLVDWVEKDRLEFNKLGEIVKNFIDNIKEFKDSFEQLKLTIESTVKKFDTKLSEFNLSPANVLRESAHVSEFSRDITNYLKEIHKTLEKIANNDHHQKLQNFTETQIYNRASYSANSTNTRNLPNKIVNSVDKTSSKKVNLFQRIYQNLKSIFLRR